MLTIVRNSLVGLLTLASKVEFHIWAGNHRRRQIFRWLYLRLMRTQHAEKVYCGPEVYIRQSGNLTLGNHCSLGFSTKIWNYSPVTIGDDFMSAAGLIINTGGHDIETMKSTSDPITIGDRCWCGLNVTILGGVHIGDDVVIAAGSVVTQDIPSSVIVAGIPAKVVRSIHRDLASYDRSDWS